MTTLFLAATVQGQLQWPNLQYRVVTIGLERPVDIQQPDIGTNRIFVVEQPGRIQVFGNEDGKQTFLDISDRVEDGGNEQGLLGLAFPPNYEEKGYFYVDYTTDRAGMNGDSVLSRFHVMEDNPNQADPESEEIVLTVDQPFGNHNGGQLQFGPDGYLYFGLGDGGSGRDPQGNAQDHGTLLGKMLRIDVEGAVGEEEAYLIPPDNPFVDVDGSRDEIWALGLRNPWRFSFDRKTGDMYIGDVGQNALEEIDFEPADAEGGRNYGWDFYEAGERRESFNSGTPPDGLIFPIFEYPRGLGISVTGGYVYRGSQFPRMQGIYLFADFGTGRIWGTQRNAAGDWQTKLLADTDLQIATFGEDQAGRLYFATLSRGFVYQITDTRDRHYGELVRHEFSEGSFSFTIGVDRQQQYRIESSTDLDEWESFKTLEPDSRRLTVTDPTGGQESRQFYRWHELEQ